MRQAIKLNEVLQLLGWSRTRFFNRKRQNRLPFQPLPRGKHDHYEFSIADVEAFLGTPIDVESLELAPTDDVRVVEDAN